MRTEALAYLLEIAVKKGYVIMDDIMDVADKFSLSFQDIDWLSNAIAERGILIYEIAPDKITASDGIEYGDYAQKDYNEIYQRAVEMEPGLEGFVEAIRDIVPAQRGEIDRLKYQVIEGNQHARERMVEIHLRAALKTALFRAEYYNLELADVLGDACVGLMIAVDKYKPDENGAFGSYATMWMIQTISRKQQICRPSLYYPVHVKDPCIVAQQLLKENGLLDEQGITDEIIARQLIIESNNEYRDNPKRIDTIINALIPLDSYEELREKLVEDDVSIEYYPKNLIFDAGLDEYADQELLKQLFSELIENMKPREKEVIELRFGLTGMDPQTLEEVGQEFGVTRERIRQIEVKAVKKLKVLSSLRRLSSFYDLGMSEEDLIKINKGLKDK